MADYGLTMEELAAAGCFDRRPLRHPTRAAAGGLLPQRRAAELGRAGDMPDWLRRAVNAGQSKECFRVG
ncbi:DNA-binding protein (plasmid) [Cupriavidus oxalaticus]|uniref:DNA-binding protein n=1 Tax=Cupriavidus oxalaticus TaxID=96344 RepID=A0A4P7LKK9_9BURK|nr:DNA-binding protein [Cupriavidus oxalaticus]